MSSNKKKIRGQCVYCKKKIYSFYELDFLVKHGLCYDCDLSNKVNYKNKLIKE